MKLLEHVVTIPTFTTPLTIIPIGCVHADDEGFDEDLFQATIHRIATTPHCYTVGLGDYRSFARTTYRKHIRSYQADEDSQRDIDNLVRQQVEDFHKKYLKAITPKLWGLAEGNHYWQFLDGTTDTQYLCQLAKVPYLEKGSFHRLRVSVAGQPRVLKMLIHHGDWSGGAQTTGGDINAAESRTHAWDADIAIFGHTHRKAASIQPIMTLPDTGQLTLVERPKATIRAGCFTKGYVQGCITYAERKLMKPTALGTVVLRVEWKRPYNAERYHDQLRAGKSPAEARKSAYMPLRHKFIVEY